LSVYGAVGDVSERTRWVIKRGKRSGSRRRTRANLFATRDAVTATGSAADNCKKQFNIQDRGVAQLVARDVWEHAGGFLP